MVDTVLIDRSTLEALVAHAEATADGDVDDVVTAVWSAVEDVPPPEELRKCHEELVADAPKVTHPTVLKSE
jgi:hypothetical protein